MPRRMIQILFSETLSLSQKYKSNFFLSLLGLKYRHKYYIALNTEILFVLLTY